MNGHYLEGVEGLKNILRRSSGVETQPAPPSLSSTGSVFWCPGGPLHGNQSRLYVCQLGYRPEPCVRTLTMPCSSQAPVCLCMWRKMRPLSQVPPAWRWRWLVPINMAIRGRGPQRLQSGPLSSLPGMLNLDHGPNSNPNSTEGGRGQVLGEPLSSLILSASSWCKLFVRITLKIKGKNKDAKLQLWPQPSDFFLRLLGGACLGSQRGKLRT